MLSILSNESQLKLCNLLLIINFDWTFNQNKDYLIINIKSSSRCICTMKVKDSVLYFVFKRECEKKQKKNNRTHMIYVYQCDTKLDTKIIMGVSRDLWLRWAAAPQTWHTFLTCDCSQVWRRWQSSIYFYKHGNLIPLLNINAWLQISIYF